MKAPAGRPGLDVRRGGECAAPRCRHLPAEARAAGRGPRAIKGRRAAGPVPLAGGARAAGGALRLRLLINPGNRALPARHKGRSQGRRGQAWGATAFPGCPLHGLRGRARGTAHRAGIPGRSAGAASTLQGLRGRRGQETGPMRWSGLSGGSLSLYIMPVGNAGRPMFTRMSRELLSIPGESPSAGPAGSLLSRPREA